MSPKRKAKSAEQAFLANYDASRYPRPSVSVDICLITAIDGKLKALMTHRDQFPEKGKWSLPGTFVGLDESLVEAANRALSKKTGVSGIFLEQLYTFGEADRDPRTRVISVAYYALVNYQQLEPLLPDVDQIQLVELDVPWEGEQGGAVRARDAQGKRLKLAFDHAEMLGLAVLRLRGKLGYAPIGFELLPRKFTLRQLQTIHETILGRKKNKDSFRRTVLASGLVVATGEFEASVGHRPAELYRFKRKRRR